MSLSYLFENLGNTKLSTLPTMCITGKLGRKRDGNRPACSEVKVLLYSSKPENDVTPDGFIDNTIECLY